MMGRSGRDQGQLFYSFNLEEAVPHDHLVRAIAGILDLSWVRAELAPHYSYTGRPIVGSVGLALRTRCQITLCSHVHATSGSATTISSVTCSSVSSRRALRLALS